jgi:hypothetical protein
MKYFRYIFGLFLLLYIGCNDNPSSNQQTLQLDPVLEAYAGFGHEVNDIVGTGSDIQDLTGGGAPSVEQEISGLAAAKTLKTLARDLRIRSMDHLPVQAELHKPQTDSLYYFYDDTAQGVRAALYYDEETSVARYYEVRYIFPAWRNMTYDSAEIAVNLNYTLDNDQDDFPEKVIRLQRFNEDFMIQNITSLLEITDHNGPEITGFEASIDTYYHQNRHLSRLYQYMDINPDQSGTLRQDFYFRDNTTASNMVTFYANYTGSFSRTFRDGTTVSGSFNSIVDDLQGSFTETIDFPEGRNIDKIVTDAMVSVTLPDSIFNATLSRSFYFASGTIRTTGIVLDAHKESGVGIVHLDLTRGNGAHGEFTLQVTETDALLAGNWTTVNDEDYVLVSGEYYIDGSCHINYRIFNMPYTPGDDPVLVADYYFSPDDEGEGTIEYKNETYTINFDRTDSAEIQKGGRTGRINLYTE